LYRYGRALFLDTVVRVDKHQLGREALDLVLVHLREGAMMTRSPTAARRAADPFTEMMRLPRSARMA
jgi:hypothetical protein